MPIEARLYISHVIDAAPMMCVVGRNMQPDPYISLTEALAKAGLTVRQNLPDQLVVSAQQGPEGPDSFWLSQMAGLWYLSTWSPVRYRVPANQDIVRLCTACVSVGTSAMGRVPPELVARFGLQEIDERQYEELFPTEGEAD